MPEKLKLVGFSEMVGVAGAVPEPRVVGGFGDTPGFDYRAHLEAVISHGSPPVSLLRRLLLPA